MAYRMQYGATVPTYESCSTAAFRKGRTECVRPATNETKATVTAFLGNEQATPQQLRAMIHNCSKIHYQLCKEGAMGKASSTTTIERGAYF